MTFAQLMENKKMSARKLANKVTLTSASGVTLERKTVYRYRQGWFTQSVELFKAIADALGVTMDELYNTKFEFDDEGLEVEVL